MANVQLLDGKDLRQALASADVEFFRYQLNRVGYTLLLAVGGVMLAAAGFIWWETALEANLWKAAFGGLLAGGLALAIYAAYWYTFASTRYVGVSDDKLFIGRREKAWTIDWSVLDAESLGFEEMNATAMNGALDVNVGGQQHELHLYNAYVFLEDIQGFMFSLLKRLQDKQQPAGEAAEDAAERPDALTE